MSRAMRKKIVFLPYDFDTAIGINNEGSLTFSYNLEDIDKVNGTEDVFNGQDSVLWKNVREMFFEEIKSMYQTLRSQGKLSYDLTETAFEEHQEKWPEALFNEDSWFKYLAPLEEKGSEAYLAMLQGSKAEQRKWWLYNRFRYLDSKYNAGDALTDVITLRGYAKSDITITPYADVYASIKYGSYLVQERAARNTSHTLECPLDNVNDTEIYIYSASQLANVGDLSGLKVGYAEFAYATRLQEIKLGDSSSSYNNGNLQTLYLGNNTLLKKIDVRNCSGLGTGDQKTVDISGCSNIEEVYFEGTNILGVELPNGGFLKKLHLPGTITNLTIRNQTKMTEFVCDDFSNVTTLFLENTSSAVDIDDIIDEVAAGCRVRLFNFYWEFESMAAVNTFLAKFDGMIGMDQNGNNTATPQIYATVHVPTATGDQIDALHENWPYIVVDADVATYYVKYYSDDGETLLYTETVNKGSNGVYSGTPSKTSTAQYSYTFAGWSLYKNSTTADSAARNNIQSNRNVYAAYTATVRTYTVYFKNSNGTVLQTVSNVPYGGSATYTGSTPVHPTDSTNNQFTGFSPDGTNITGDTNCIAQYRDLSSPVVKYLNGTLEEYTSGQSATKIAQYAFYNMTTLKTVETYATTLETNAFSGCSNLEKIDMKATSGVVSFNATSLQTAKLMSIFLRSSDTATLSGSLPIQFTGGLGAVYVPSAKVDTYKAASGWTTYKSHICSIDDYPVTDFDTIKDSLSEMCTKLANGTANYDVGDFKTIDLGTEGLIRMQVAAKNADELASGSGNAAYTWVAMDLLNTSHRMNPGLSGTTEGTGAIGGWGKSEMRTYLSTTIWALIPAELQAVIKEVKKYSYIYDTSSTEIANDETSDKLWIPSVHEVFNNTTYESQGPSYTGIFTSNSDRILYKPGASSAYYWWERSAHSTSRFRIVNYYGNDNYYNAYYSSGVLLGFCT